MNLELYIATDLLLMTGFILLSPYEYIDFF